MTLNSQDGGNRKFILVQLPETCDESTEAFKAGYKTIADISKERIRRVGTKLLEGKCHQDWKRHRLPHSQNRHFQHGRRLLRTRRVARGQPRSVR
jgi:hypothetical protein